MVDRSPRDALLKKVEYELDLHGAYEHVPAPEAKVASLEHAAQEWIKAKAARGLAAATIERHCHAWNRIARDTRSLEKLRDDEPIPVTILSVGHLTRLLQSWIKEGIGEARRYELSLGYYRAWVWMADLPREFPGVPAPPRDRGNLLPPAPLYGDAPDAPTLAEADAICRRAAMAKRRRYLREIVATARHTGLRISQILGIHVGDINVEHATLVVVVGKSRREKAGQRLIPVHRELINILGPLLRGRAEQDLVFPSLRGPGPRKPPANAVHELWEGATAAGEVRREVWYPPTAKQARPDHGFRSAFLAALADAGVQEPVRHHLVGHAPTTTEGRHYARPSMASMRDAIDKLPPIDWAGPGAGGKVVALASRRGPGQGGRG